jgi:Uma2 family endonuclease
VAIELRRRPFTVAEYYRMAEAGILTEDDRVELLDGEIVAMTPIGSRHAAVVDRLTRLLTRAAGEGAIVRVQNPIRLGEHSEPQPDLALLRSRPDYYADRHPGPGEVWLVVEVAEASIEIDRKVKVPLYARAGIPEVWLVVLPDERVEVYRRPTPGGYQEVQQLGRGARVATASLPDLALPVDDLLG